MLPYDFGGARFKRSLYLVGVAVVVLRLWSRQFVYVLRYTGSHDAQLWSEPDLVRWDAPPIQLRHKAHQPYKKKNFMQFLVYIYCSTQMWSVI